MKRKILASLLTLCAMAGQAQETKNSNSAPLDSIIIEGVVKNIPDGTHIQITRYETKDAIVKDGKFRIALLPQQEEEIYALRYQHSHLSIYAKPGMKIKVKGDDATFVNYWFVESDHFDQKENNAYNQFVKDKLPDYYELENKAFLANGRRLDASLTQEKRDKANQEENISLPQLLACRKEKYNTAMLDFMKDRPFSKRMIDELRMIATYDKTPAIVEKAREVFKKIPEEAMNERFVKDIKARLYADQVKVGGQMKDFTLFDRKGNKHKLSEFKGKYTILEFTFVGCGGCMFIKPYLEDFYKRNKDKAEIIAIYNDTEKNWMEEGQEHKVSYHEWNDHARSAEPVAAYGATVFPTFVIIDPDGKILEMPAGSSGFLNVFKYIPDAELEKKLKEAIKS